MLEGEGLRKAGLAVLYLVAYFRRWGWREVVDVVVKGGQALRGAPHGGRWQGDVVLSHGGHHQRALELGADRVHLGVRTSAVDRMDLGVYLDLLELRRHRRLPQKSGLFDGAP